MDKYKLISVNDKITKVELGDKSFNITKTAESYNIDGDYFVSYDELQTILTEIRLTEALNSTTDLKGN